MDNAAGRRKKKSLLRELKAVEETYAATLDWLELGELRSWVEAGNSPYENPEQVIHEDGPFFDFIVWHRTARWVTVMRPLTASGPSDRELFDFYTDRLTTVPLKKQKNSFRTHRPFWAVRSLPLWIS